MAYSILNTDGTILLLLADGQKDESATSLTLIGKNYSAYGQDLNNNFVKLLANFASTYGTSPRSPIKGQLWYDTTNRRLKVYDNGFKVVGSVIVATSEPPNLQSGDLWWDSNEKQMNLYNAGSSYIVGPNFPSSIGESGWVLPSSPIKDVEDVAQQVMVLKTYGDVIGLAYHDDSNNNQPFEMNQDDALVYLPGAPNNTVVSGVTLLGDLVVTGQLSNNYLSTYVDLNILPNVTNADADAEHVGTSTFSSQNMAIEDLLEKLFPPNASGLTNLTTPMAGLPIGTQARVLCQYSSFGGNPVNGYQVRVFHTVGTHNSSQWSPYLFNTTGTNITTNVIW